GAVESDRFSDYHSAKAASIHRSNLAASIRLLNSAGKSFAGSGTAACVLIIAHARYPRSGGLGLNARHKQEGDSKHSASTQSQSIVVHHDLLELARVGIRSPPGFYSCHGGAGNNATIASSGPLPD